MSSNGKHGVPKGLNKEKLCQKLTEEITKLKEKSCGRGLSNAEVVDFLTRLRHPRREPAGIGAKVRWLALTVFFPIAVGLLLIYARHEIVAYFVEDPCLIGSNFILSEVGRPLASCELCRNLTAVPVYDTITPAEFVAKHAYNIRPALITGATTTWTAMETFSFNYFKELYTSHPEALQAVEEECQFFPYNTEFTSLEEAFKMSPERAALKEGERNWYFGWSNCDPLVAAELRRHYQRPYFLPDSSESSALDWIFMGGAGRGAGIHLDNVAKPSWQAQLSGRKTWTLIPLPECEDICHTLKVTVNTGDIIVLDTNQWYHTTQIHPGKISITIGSEFD
ncbi:bifunctional arginine demethylase and lysyl-hydroxylase PSR-like [Acanthaster planci]|uniref:Bifunctional arginine demethylase and lysyl-hydroxylase PSR-like n=1 Tax=Acanthaster planci TaxID=133434 RepID=A0A8B7Y9U0_ACAPL|nr:bifunctional arginine demethylase and lysyl-hydroxylase PSR-like [Acanthaster planci]